MAKNTQMRLFRFIAPAVARIILSLTFAYAAIAKMIDPVSLYTDIQSYRLLSDTLALSLAYFIPALEAILAIALWIPRYRKAASGTLAGLIAIFTMAITISWLRGIDISCGCFGSDGSTAANYPYLIGRDLLLLALACFLLYSERWHPRRTTD